MTCDDHPGYTCDEIEAMAPAASIVRGATADIDPAGGETG